MLVNVNEYNKEMQRRGQRPWDGKAIGQSKPSGEGQGTPLPGGGCWYRLPDGNTVHRMDVNCDGTPTAAALAARGNNASGGGAAGAGGNAEPHGQTIRKLISDSKPFGQGVPRS